MIRQRYAVQSLTQSNEGGDLIGSLSLVPIVEPVLTDGTATTSRAMGAAPVRPTRQSVVPIQGIVLDDLLAENLKVGDVVTVTVAKEQV